MGEAREAIQAEAGEAGETSARRRRRARGASRGAAPRRARLYPLPGGARRYKPALDWLVAWIRGARPTVAAFREALGQRFDVTGPAAAEAYLRMLEGAGLVERRGGALVPTAAGEAYGDAPAPAALFEQLHARYVGLLETLALADVPGVRGGPCTKRLLEGLLETAWRTGDQVACRRSWLAALGLVRPADAGDALTPLGRAVLLDHAGEVEEIKKRVEDLLAEDREADIERAEVLAWAAAWAEEAAAEAAAAENAPDPAEPPAWRADRLDLTEDAVAPHLGPLEAPPALLARICAALSSGKHVLLAGPPGTGKTEIALAVGRAAQAAGHCGGVLAATASAEWTSFDTLGGYALDKSGALRFRPGVLLAALERRQWLLVDELNRADADRAFGELWNVLAGGATTTPYALDDGRLVSVGPDPRSTHPIPPSFRLLATMNTWDRTSLFRLSYALQRRFAIVHVGVPGDAAYARLLERHAAEGGAGPPLDPRLLERLKALFRASGLLALRPVGPAIARDMVRYMRRRGASGDGLAEAIAMFLLPQLEGLGREAADARRRITAAVAGLASPAALAELETRLDEILPDARRTGA